MHPNHSTQRRDHAYGIHGRSHKGRRHAAGLRRALSTKKTLRGAATDGNLPLTGVHLGKTGAELWSNADRHNTEKSFDFRCKFKHMTDNRIASKILALIRRTSTVGGCRNVFSFAPRYHRVGFHFEQRRAGN